MRPRQSGQVLDNKYLLIRLLGKGGMGAVWKAQHLTLNAPVALKFIDEGKLDARAQQRFLAEARMAAALRSPHVVQILDYGVDDGAPHIAMELLVGESLAERLARVERLSNAETMRVMQQVARAVGRAHAAGIVHRDLKPENVFIVANDDDDVVKVLDFGIAKANQGPLGDSAASPTRTGVLLGTPHYMSPEQVDGADCVDHRTDIWALGVLAFRCITGQLPFAGDGIGGLVIAICSRPLPIPSSIVAVPVGFDRWFAHACSRNVEDRFQSVREMAEELRNVLTPSLDGAPLVSAQPTTVPHSPRGTPPRAATVKLPEQAPQALGTTEGTTLLPAREGVRRRAGMISLGGAALVVTVAMTHSLWRAVQEPREKSAATHIAEVPRASALASTAAPSVTVPQTPTWAQQRARAAHSGSRATPLLHANPDADAPQREVLNATRASPARQEDRPYPGEWRARNTQRKTQRESRVQVPRPARFPASQSPSPGLLDERE